MPEGDVVYRTARRLHAALAGRVLLSSDLRWPSLATTDLRGRTVVEVVSVGKHVLARLSASAGGGSDGAVPLTLHSHLKMEGAWEIRSSRTDGSARRPRGGRPERESDVRAVLVNAEWTAVGRRLGMLDLLPTSREAGLVGHLGPDLLGADWGPASLARALSNLRQNPERPVGEALLDQRLVAGIGTFYMAEALFVRGITPWTPVAEVVDVEGLVVVAQRMLEVNSRRAGQVTTGVNANGRQQWVHGRAGRPCRRCGTPVRVAPLGSAPHDRVAFYCPSCQRGPVP
ncbi:MAG: DNA-formamidopyrimidine glycosylase family protein [Actinomycetes bacterium]